MGALVLAGGAAAIGSRGTLEAPSVAGHQPVPSRVPRLAPGAVRTEDALRRVSAVGNRLRDELNAQAERAAQAQRSAVGDRGGIDCSLSEVCRRALVRALMPHVEAIARYQSRPGMNGEGSVREADVAYFEAFPARYGELSAKILAEFQAGLALVRQRAATQAEIESLTDQALSAPTPEQRAALESRVRGLVARAQELQDAEAPIDRRMWAVAAIDDLDDRTAWTDEPESVRVVVRPARPVNAPDVPALTMAAIPVESPFSLHIRMKAGIGPDLMRFRLSVGHELRLLTARRNPDEPREFSTESTAHPLLWWTPGAGPAQPQVQP